MNYKDIMLEAVIESAKHPIVITDKNFMILHSNRNWQNLWKYRNQQFYSNTQFIDLLPDKKMIDLIKTSINTTGQWSGEITVTQKMSKPFTFESQCRLVTTENCPNPILMFTFIDINDQKNVEKMLKKAQIEASSASQLKSNFIANISHELRTPLNGITGLTELLLYSDPTEKQIRYLKMIQQSSQQLLDIINSILDFSRLNSEKIKLENTVFDISSEIEAILSLLKSKAKMKNLKIAVKMDNAIPRQLSGDCLKLMQVLYNIIDNGIKFTYEGQGKRIKFFLLKN
jgi:signal transduction histidine kinase